MGTVGNPGETLQNYTPKNPYAQVSSNLLQSQHEIFKIQVPEQYTVHASKPDSGKQEDDSDDLVFSSTISAHVNVISKPRTSILSLQEQGTKDEKCKNHSVIRRYAGIVFALLATVGYSVVTLMHKLCQHYHPLTVSSWRFFGLILTTTPLVAYYFHNNKQSVLKGIWPLTERKSLNNILMMLLSSFNGSFCVAFQIYAIKYLTMADVTVILCSSAVFVLFTARILLGEKTGYFAIVLAVLTVAGVAVISRPPILTGESLDENTLLGIMLAMGAMFTATLAFVTVRYLRIVHYTVLMLSYGIQSTIQCVSLAVMIDVFDIPKTFLDWALFAGLVVFTWAAQITFVLALQFEQCSVVSLIASLETCFIFVIEFIFFGVVPDQYSLIGATIIMTGVIATTFRKYVAMLPKEDKTRQRFALILK